MKECCKDGQTEDNFEKAIAEDQKQSYLEKLKNKWQLKSILQVIFVLLIFTIGGSTCAFLAKKTISLFVIDNRTLYYWPQHTGHFVYYFTVYFSDNLIFSRSI
jgi:hypothetical protein